VRRIVVLAALALVLGSVAGVSGASWWSDTTRERAAEQVRLIVTADDAWLGQLEIEGCSTVPLEIYNAGDRPVVLSALRASVAREDSSDCRDHVDPVTIAPHTTVSHHARFSFRCADQSGEPRFTATVGTSDTDSVTGAIELRPFGQPYFCESQPSTFWVDSVERPRTGSSPRLPITMVATSPIPGAKLSALTLLDTGAFALHPRTRLPLDISSLAPGAAPPEVRVEASLTVRDCERAREFRPGDVTLKATFTPDDKSTEHTLVDRRDILRLMQLIDAAC
jgi:hypothetical protein